MSCELNKKSGNPAEKKIRNRKVDKKWTSDEDRLMVELVKERDALWDVRSPNYKNRDLKIIGWAEVAEKTNHSFEGTKNHWNAIRSRFFAERKKMATRKSRQSGCTFNTRFTLFKSLQFLCKIGAGSTRETLTNMTIGSESDVGVEDSTFGQNYLLSPNNSLNDSFKESELKILAAKKRRQTQSMNLPQNAERTALIGEISDFFNKEGDAIPEELNWRRSFVDFVFHELNRYDEHNAHSLKHQILMVCLNFQPEDQFMLYKPAEDSDEKNVKQENC